MISFFKLPTRRLLIRASLFLNFCVLTYVALQAAQTGSSSGAGPDAAAAASPGGTLAEMDALIGGVVVPRSEVETESLGSISTNPVFSAVPSQALATETETEASPSAGSDVSTESERPPVPQQPVPTRLGLDCKDRDNHFSYTQRGAYWILNNYVPAKRRWGCDESITYTTHGDITFLDNVVPLAKRWDGPLSMAVYTPGADYEAAIRSIAYLRQCAEPEVSEKVTFHLVLDERHFPTVVRKLHPEQGSLLAAAVSAAASGVTPEPLKTVSGLEGPTASAAAAGSPQGNKVLVRNENGQVVVRVVRSNGAKTAPVTSTVAKSEPEQLDELGLPVMDCTQPAPWTTAPAKTYKQTKNLTYPVNLLRNVARMNAGTHYILASDAELYPNLNLIPPFFDMIRRNESVLHLGRPKVFVLPIFEVYANQTVPSNKAELVGMLQSGMAVPFHQKVCSYCHSVPKSKEWLVSNITDGLHVFHVAKRHKPYQRWEPIYIGTQDDPLYDERLTWEGKSDKMTQGYALCVLDYDFMILDNAFLVHRPGVKVPKREPVRDAMAKKQSAIIRSAIYRELKILYGYNPNCVL